MDARPGDSDWIGLVDARLPVEEATTWATTPGSGAVVSFLGVVRDNSEGRPGVTGLTYEAYVDQAEGRLHRVGEIVRNRWPAVERIVLLHRLGDLTVSEVSVAVVVSAPHRPEAFEAGRFAIDAVKEMVPIWKREHWSQGSDWAECGHDVVSPSPEASRADTVHEAQ